uniref:Uncharacterized protein n=1 Tax=Oryza nivara TaxID=4536 RepID=A0A0E0FXX8_ORYNI
MLSLPFSPELAVDPDGDRRRRQLPGLIATMDELYEYIRTVREPCEAVVGGRHRRWLSSRWRWGRAAPAPRNLAAAAAMDGWMMERRKGDEDGVREVDILLDRLKETGTKSMDMATLDQTTYFTLGCDGP